MEQDTSNGAAAVSQPTPKSGKKPQLSGVVIKMFAVRENWSAGVVKTPGNETIRFSGKGEYTEGQAVTLVGKWDEWNGTRTFKVADVVLDYRELDPEGLVNWMATCPAVKGIGPVTAWAIVRAFGDRFAEVLEESPDDLLSIARVDAGVIESLRKAWLDDLEHNAARVQLSGWGLTNYQISLALAAFGNGVLDVLRINPFTLARKVKGLGFRMVDKIARTKLDIDRDHPGRIRAGINEIVTAAVEEDGSTMVLVDEVLSRAADLLMLDESDGLAAVAAQLEEAREEFDLEQLGFDGEIWLARASLMEAEEEIAARFLSARGPGLGVADQVTSVLMLPDGDSIDLTAEQLAAVKVAAEHNLSTITGPAGTGKTTIIRSLVQAAQLGMRRYVICAFAGKAQKRISEATGLPACTIHRLLGYNGKEYRHDRDDPLTEDLIVVDEASMIPAELMARLFEAAPHSAICLVGDIDQLPPIGAGAPFRDAIESQTVETARLTLVKRHAGELLDNCGQILKGQIAPTNKDRATGLKAWYKLTSFRDPDAAERFIVDKLIGEYIPKGGLDARRDVVLLAPKKDGPLGRFRLSRLLQAHFRGGRASDQIEVGDRVIWRRNDYVTGLMNGDIGYVRAVHPEEAKLTVDWEGLGVLICDRPKAGVEEGQIELAWCLTVHLAQGSQFPAVIMALSSHHQPFLNRNMLYTGVTRAQKHCFLIGDPYGPQTAVETKKDLDRVTSIQSRIEATRTGQKQTQTLEKQANQGSDN